ncbi:efflux RND transporter periplasmic adaptor subunit [Wenxinia saemankumensis]|uniref:Membrane fusion protein, multidrug efflux system n=1 Tax=Wenxinia saemankumensis TaxID=1447782 RepID=A0A1M6EPP9_9RHOB|nr:efflux RND transporter periplasmic adaptor subunit [Wenxinia saemankumensis]SHI87328.1 membrane fusion protein, multidrug efflux system [Wenxinia saemankumensis]
MRLLPILTAILVSALLYFLVIDRETLWSFVGRAPAAAAELPEDEIAPPAERTAETGREAVRVVAMSSTAQPIDSAVILRGRTEAARMVEVRAETSGQVVSEPLRRGAIVEAGDTLCELDPGTRAASLQEARARLVEAEARLPEAESQIPAAEAALAEARARRSEGDARVAEARARLSEAEINLNAQRRLAEGGYTSDTQVAGAEAAFESARAGVTAAEASIDGIESGIASAEAGIEGATAAVEGVRAQIESARAAVASAEQEIGKLTITAPFGGLLETDTAELGALLQPGTACATVIRLDEVKLVGFVSEMDVSRIDVGSPLRATLASGRTVEGRVTFLSRSSDETTRTFRLEATVPNPDLSIRDGETAEMLVAAEGREAHLLPQSALTLDDDGRLGIRTVAEGDLVGFQAVELLRDTPQGVWVAGLPEEVDVIVVGQEYVVPGVAVDPTYREAGG